MDDLSRSDAWQSAVGVIPLGRAGTGDDIAHTVTFLCSEEASWITGQTWNVDSGTVIH